MSDTAVAADPTLNPAQAGPAVPNQDRAPANPADKPADTPADKPADTPADTPADAPTDVPTLGGDDLPDNSLEAPTSADAVDGVITYPKTGDVGMDTALEWIGKLGIGMDHPAMQATLDGDFSLIRAHLATLGDKAAGAEQMCNLAEEANTRFVERANAAAAAISTAVSGVLGEGQKDILAWASQNATADEKRSINAMLAADPVQARAAATILLNAYQAASGTVVEPASAITATTGDAPAQSLTRISRSEFARETNKLHAKYGAGYNQSTEYATLLRRLG